MASPPDGRTLALPQETQDFASWLLDFFENLRDGSNPDPSECDDESPVYYHTEEETRDLKAVLREFLKSYLSDASVPLSAVERLDGAIARYSQTRINPAQTSIDSVNPTFGTADSILVPDSSAQTPQNPTSTNPLTPQPSATDNLPVVAIAPETSSLAPEALLVASSSKKRKRTPAI